MFPERYSALVVGSPAAGMFEFCTCLSAFYLQHGQGVVFVEADTSVTIIKRQLMSYGIKIGNYEESMLTFIDCFSPCTSLDDDKLVADPSNLPELLEKIKMATQSSVNPVRVIFDSLSPLHIQNTPEQVHDFIRRLANSVMEKGSLTATIHKEMHTPEQINPLVEICDGLIEMKIDERLKRFIRISRMQAVDVEQKWVPFEIDQILGAAGASLMWKGPESDSMD